MLQIMQPYSLQFAEKSNVKGYHTVLFQKNTHTETRTCYVQKNRAVVVICYKFKINIHDVIVYAVKTDLFFWIKPISFFKWGRGKWKSI